MAFSNNSHRAVCAGLSCGVCLVAPALAYAATLPLDGPSAQVAAAAMPFAVGAVAGVGIYAATLAVFDRKSADAIPAEFEAVHEDVEAPSAASVTHAEHENAIGKRFKKIAENGIFGSADSGVPVIERANAMSDEDAWAMIDSIMDEPNIGCVPGESMDLYQIALAELAAENRPTGALSSNEVMAAAVSAADRMSQSAGSTAVYMAMAGVEAEATESVERTEDQDTEADRAAALASLDTPANLMLKRMDVIGAPAEEAAARAQQVAAKQQDVAVGAAAAVPAPVQLHSVLGVELDENGEVPMADYSGREGIWAQAFAIMEELDAPAAAEPEPVVYVAKHMAPAKAQIVDEEPEASADAFDFNSASDRARAAKLHAHVNALLADEVGSFRSGATARRKSHDYLRVIEGGTAPMQVIAAAEA